MSELAATISPMPSEIMAKVVPARLVVTYPKPTPKSSPATPPTSGTRTRGASRSRAAASSCLPRPHQSAGPEDEDRDHQQIGHDWRELRQGEPGEERRGVDVEADFAREIDEGVVHPHHEGL